MYTPPYQENTTRLKKFKMLWYIYKKFHLSYKKDRNRSKQIPGGLAQMVERTLCMREARGSMPLSSKTLFFAFLYALVKFYASWSVRCANFYVNWVSRTGEMFQRERFWIIFFFFPCFLEEYHGSWCFLACSFTSLTKR